MEVGGGSRAHFVVARPRAPLLLLLHRSHLAIYARFSVIVECLSTVIPCQQSSLVSHPLETSALCMSSDGSILPIDLFCAYSLSGPYDEKCGVTELSNVATQFGYGLSVGRSSTRRRPSSKSLWQSVRSTAFSSTVHRSRSLSSVHC